MRTRLGTLVMALLIAPVVAACTDAAVAAAGETGTPQGLAVATENEMVVYLTPTCGCCMGWVEHMRENGFNVRVAYMDDLSSVRREHGVPVDLTSCHMGVVDGFAIEGHVPADVVQKVLRDRPDILGVAVPGMVTGTPGMESPDGRVDPYDVHSFDESGDLGVYESRR